MALVGSPYYTMELLEGEDLSVTLAREGPLPWGRVRKIAFQIGRAINLAHARGIIHRDLKPANCFRMTRDGNPDFIKVLDFGIAKVLAANTLTGDGVMIGSPHYMSPEQTRGPLLDPRADIYSLGVVLYEFLSGSLLLIALSVESDRARRAAGYPVIRLVALRDALVLCSPLAHRMLSLTGERHSRAPLVRGGGREFLPTPRTR